MFKVAEDVQRLKEFTEAINRRNSVVVEHFVFYRSNIVKYCAKIKRENADMSNEKYSVNLYRCKFKDFSVPVICNE